MPPPRKLYKMRGGGKWRAGKKWATGEPRVILRPLRSESSGKSRYRFTTLSPTAAHFNKPDLSDIKLIVGDETFYAHRLILCSASDVFARMLGSDWIESQRKELVLQEEEECVKVFDRFLYYFYSGSIIISDSYVIPLFMLADKYNVTQLYNECVKQIENGLKIYTYVNRPDEEVAPPGEGNQPSGQDAAAAPGDTPGPSGSRGRGSGAREPPRGRMVMSCRRQPCDISSSSSSSDSSDSESSDGGQPDTQYYSAGFAPPSAGPPGPAAQGPPPPAAAHTHLPVPFGPPPGKRPITEVVGSETFPLLLVMKMLMFSQNERISKAALYNLEARLCSQIRHDNFGVWNDLPRELLVRMLEDDFFYCNEYFLFCAAKSWLDYREERRTEEILTDVLCCIRYPILTAEELYSVEKDDILHDCPAACKLVRNAVRFKLFRNFPRAQAEEDWTGQQFEPRKVKDDH